MLNDLRLNTLMPFSNQ